MLVVYLRCNGGHYFSAAPACPIDGWSDAGVAAVLAALDELRRTGQRPTINLLHEYGAPRSILNRIIVIEFGSTASVFEAMEPAGYLLAGEWKTLSEAGPAFS
jgi:hypothetical protein